MSSELICTIEGDGYTFYVYKESPRLGDRPKTPDDVFIRVKSKSGSNGLPALLRVYDFPPCPIESVLPWGVSVSGSYRYTPVPSPGDKEAFQEYQEWEKGVSRHWRAVPLKLKKSGGKWFLCRSEWFRNRDNWNKNCSGWAWLKRYGSLAEELANAGVSGKDPELSLDSYLNRLNAWVHSEYYVVRVNAATDSSEIHALRSKRFSGQNDALDAIWTFCLTQQDIDFCLVDILINFRWIQMRLFLPVGLKERGGDLLSWLQNNWSVVGTGCEEAGVPENAILTRVFCTEDPSNE